MAQSSAVLSELPDGGVLRPAMLARQYDPPSYADAFEAVEDYRRVHECHAATGKKSSALSSDVDLPRSRIRPWLNGSAPDPVRAIAEGIERDWFADTEPVTSAWATLVIATFAGGSIASEHPRPYWTVDPAAAGTMVRQALDTLQVGASERQRTGRPNQLQAASCGLILGRALLALGCVRGDTNEQTPPLPDWLLDVPPSVQLPACRVLVLFRGVAFADKDTVVLLENRSEAYRESVVQLFGGVVDGRISNGEKWVTVSAAAARELGVGRGGPLRAAIESE